MEASSRRRWRFAAWVAVVVVLLVGQAAWLRAVGGGRRFAWGGLAAGEVFVGLMAGLLRTTPANAIRLRRGVSEGVILAGTGVLQACGSGPGAYAAAVLAGCGLLLWALRRKGASPWWAAVVAWNPAVAVAGTLAVRWTG